MEQFKRAQVIMLPTNNKNQGIYLSPVPSINKIHYWDKRISNSYIAQHLYIISDDEAKENDLYIESDHKGFGFIKYKIIATTDISLKLPQPSQQFIEKYIESYNKGEIITDVLVEYHGSFGHYDGDTWYAPKVNPKDNTITIKKLKDSWNREEVIKLLNILNNTLNIGSDLTLEQWIEENL